MKKIPGMPGTSPEPPWIPGIPWARVWDPGTPLGPLGAPLGPPGDVPETPRDAPGTPCDPLWAPYGLQTLSYLHKLTTPEALDCCDQTCLLGPIA